MSDFSQYRLISAKLKKRFLLRKPNLSEASEQFSALSRELREFKPYSAYCCLAVARCEQNMANTSQQMQALLDAARLFRDGQQINAAISAYSHALKVCDAPLLVAINAELANMYKREKRYIEASNAFIEANLHKEAALCYLSANRYELALQCFGRLSREELDTNDLVTIYLLQLYLHDVNKFDFQFPIIECHPQNDELNDLNITLESLLISLRMNGENDHNEQQTRNAIASHLFSKLNATHNQLLYLIITDKC